MSQLKINRVLAANLKDPYEKIQFKKVKSSIKNADGSTAMESDELVVPAHWSSIAVDILARNYFRKRGIPKYTKRVEEAGIPEWLQCSIPDESKILPGEEMYGQETDARKLFDRIAGTWTYWGFKYNYFDSEEDARNYFDEMRYMLAMQMAAPNSPQWFNTGLHWAYGFNGGKQGHYYFDSKTNSLQESSSAYARPQTSACFIQSVNDDLVNEGGIMELWKSEARLFKYGSGSGTNFSRLRGKGEQLSGGGFSSGLMSFLKIGDVAGGSIKSGGSTRRAAKMVIVDIDHPDIEEFIQWKNKEGNKVIDLVVGSQVVKRHTDNIVNHFKKGFGLREAIATAQVDLPEKYLERVVGMLQNDEEVEVPLHTLDWENGAYTSVFGQNSNNSVRVSDMFMEAVEKDEDFNLCWRTDGRICKTLRANYLWDEISKAAWGCADPGLQFDDTVNAWHTCLSDDRINGSNPCSEYMFLDNTACNLASLNLCSFLDKEKLAKFEIEEAFNIDLFKHSVRLWTIALEISVTMSQFPTKDIALRTHQYRTLGLGYGNLGGLLMTLGIAYDSIEGRQTAAGITALMQGIAYDTSVQMAQCLGAFDRYEANKDSMMRVIKNHAVAAGLTSIEMPISVGFYNNPAANGAVNMQIRSQQTKPQGDSLQSAQGNQNAKGNYQEPYAIGFASATTTVPLTYENLNVIPPAFQKEKCVFKNLGDQIEKTWKSVLQKGSIFGFRNAQVSVIAPTGTIGLVMDFKTTGIEPHFSQIAIKQLAGGGVFKIVNDEIDAALHILKYTSSEINDIEKYIVGYGHLDGNIELNERWLISKGFNDEDLTKLNEQLAKSFNLKQAFNHYTLPVALFDRLGISEKEYKSADFDLLKKLGANDKQIEEANCFCCGHLTIEGAPHIKDSHLHIFDCARPSGDGKRSLSAAGHLQMMAAVQPFISGAISKTINLPADASIVNCKDAYMLAWKLALKAVALYRDGSKYSQVLTTGTKSVLSSMIDSHETSNKNITSNAASNNIHNLSNQSTNGGNELYNQAKKADGLAHNSMLNENTLSNSNSSHANRLARQSEDLFKPFRRRGYTQHVLIGNNTLWHTTGEDENGKLRNILLTYGKEGSTLRGWASAWGRILSMFLQEKGDEAFIRVYKAFKHSKFEPMGQLQGHPNIKYASSIPDYIVEDLAYEYPEMLSVPYSPNVLPSQRNAKIFKVRIAQESMYIIIGEDTTGRPMEVFVSGIGNEGSDLTGWMSSCAKMLSIYFQECPETGVWHFIHAFEGSSFEPSGFIEGHPNIRSATSPLDFLAKLLRLHYSHVLSGEQIQLPLNETPGNTDLSNLMLKTSRTQANSGGGNDSSSTIKGIEVFSADDLKIKAMNGYKVDEPCSECRSFRLRYNGTCYVCDNCFTTTGCS